MILVFSLLKHQQTLEHIHSTPTFSTSTLLYRVQRDASFIVNKRGGCQNGRIGASHLRVDRCFSPVWLLGRAVPTGTNELEYSYWAYTKPEKQHSVCQSINTAIPKTWLQSDCLGWWFAGLSPRKSHNKYRIEGAKATGTFLGLFMRTSWASIDIGLLMDQTGFQRSP